MWRCEYCGHQQDIDARKVVTWSGVDSDWCAGTFLEMNRELYQRIADVKIEIFDASSPIFVEAVNALADLGKAMRI